MKEAFVLVLVIVSAVTVSAVSLEPIWISPKNTTQREPADVLENFVAAKGVWADVPGGIGARAGPSVHFDSKGILWIVGGSTDQSINLNAGWNYDLDSDRYRWVAGQAQSTSRYQNPGTKGVESPDVFPGYLGDASTSVIDSKDQIWIYAENSLFRWNTSNGYFTFIGGDPSNPLVFPEPGTLGEPSAEVWPGGLDSACMVLDSLDNIWLIGGMAYGSTNNEALNAVWHYNTTSGYWSLVYGNGTGFTANNFAENIFGGRSQFACEIDEYDQIWVYGGFTFSPDTGDYFALGDMWAFNTSTWTWTNIISDTIINRPPVIEIRDEFSPNNWPGSRYNHRMINRLDGSLMLYGGFQGFDGYYYDDLWIFNLTTYQWKIALGGENYSVPTHANHSNYRTPGSVLGYRGLYGVARGKTNKGQLLLFGGTDDVARVKDVWIFPRDLCSLGLQECLPEATCTFVDDWRNACICPEGQVGDGKTSCSLPVPVAEPISEPIMTPVNDLPQSAEPIMVPAQPPKQQQTSNGTRFISRLLVLIVLFVI